MKTEVDTHTAERLSTSLNRPSMTMLGDFSDIVRYRPFSRTDHDARAMPVDVFLDFDGVVSVPMQRVYSREKSIARIHALKRVAQVADSLTFWSGRFVPSEDGRVWRNGLRHMFDVPRSNRSGISKFPFMTAGSQERFAAFINRVNPDCTVRFSLGSDKLLQRSTFADSAQSLLQEGSRVVVVGSSIVDRRNIKKLVDKIQKENNQDLFAQLHYFDTGHLFI
jgi:hypothetical protein